MKIKSQFTDNGNVAQVVYEDCDSFDHLLLEKVTQVYAVCFLGDQMLVVHNKHVWGLVGGGLEKGETYEECLKREIKEESNMRVLSFAPIGAQEVQFDGKIIYQLRYACVIQPFGDFVSDPDEDVSEIKLIDPKNYKQYFDWGEIGDRIINRSIEFKDSLLIVNRILVEDVDFEYFINIVPELAVLKNVIENNAVHKDESVYDHTQTVFENTRLLVKKYGFSNTNKNIFLLYLSIFLHDLGKKDTIIRSNNITVCNGHEDESEKLIKNSDILERFSLSMEDKIWVLKFIKNHVKIHKTLDKDDQYFESSIRDLKSEFPDMFIEYLIFGIADIKDSYFKEFNNNEYIRRINLLEKEILKCNSK